MNLLMDWLMKWQPPMITAIVAVITAFVGVLAFGWGVITYRDTKRRTNREHFLKEQFTLCFHASDYAARLATESDRTKWDEARREFWRLYYGPLCIVENNDVAMAMIAVGNLIPTPEMPPPDRLPIADKAYRDATIRLGHKLRQLIQDAWGVDLGSIT